MIMHIIFINLWYCLIWHTVWRLEVNLPKPIYKKFSCYKNDSSIWCIFLNPEHTQRNYLFPQTFYPFKCYMLKKYPLSCLTFPAWMLRLTFVISLLTLIQSTGKRPGFLDLEIIISKLQDRIKIKVFFLVLELNFGTQFPTNFVNSPRDLLKTIFMTYCSRSGNIGWLCWSTHSATKIAKSADTT